ncbi:MAG TPA: aminopeptidase P family protein, partial [Bacteroidales bacterium]|nr:aminopeptidase P family protein [Bacteroidales bacterium]
KTLPLSDIPAYLNRQIKLGRRIHFLPPYRAQTTLQLSSWLGIAVDSVKNYASEELIKGVVSLREVKDSGEIAEIEAMVNVAKEMHVAAMKMAKPGTIEREVAGT